MKTRRRANNDRRSKKKNNDKNFYVETTAKKNRNRTFSLRWPAASANFLEQKKVVYITKRLNQTPTGVV